MAPRLRGELDPATVEAAVVVVAERPGQQAGAGQHLEPVADPDDRSTARHERVQCVARRTGEVEAEHAAGAEGVAVAEPAGDDDDAGVVEQLGRWRPARRSGRLPVRRRRGRGRARRRCRGWSPARRRRGQRAGSLGVLRRRQRRARSTAIGASPMIESTGSALTTPRWTVGPTRASSSARSSGRTSTTCRPVDSANSAVAEVAVRAAARSSRPAGRRCTTRPGRPPARLR